LSAIAAFGNYFRLVHIKIVKMEKTIRQGWPPWNSSVHKGPATHRR